MPTLEDMLELVRDARDHVESGRVNDAAWLLEAIEDDLDRVAEEARRKAAPHHEAPHSVRTLYSSSAHDRLGGC